MKKNIKGLQYRGNGFFLYTDESNPRLSDLDVAKKIGKALGKRVRHITSSPQLLFRAHVLQYEHLYEKDMERETKRLTEKYNN